MGSITRPIAVTMIGAALATCAVALPATAAQPSAVGISTSAAANWTHTGNWKSTRTYNSGDVVRYKGKSYVATKTNKHHSPRGSKMWRVVAADGTDAAHLVARDSRGPLPGVFVGAWSESVTMMWDGGLWDYDVSGSTIWAGRGWSLRYADSACTGNPSMPALASEIKRATAEAHSMFRYVETVGGLATGGFKVSGPHTPQVGAQLYVKKATDGTCEADTSLFTGELFELTRVTMPRMPEGPITLS